MRVDFLVYGECVCGWHCACPEGAIWPDCPVCGLRVMPVRVAPAKRPGVMQGYGYVAEMYLEGEAAVLASRRGYDFILTRGRTFEPLVVARQWLKRFPDGFSQRWGEASIGWSLAERARQRLRSAELLCEAEGDAAQAPDGPV